MKQTSLFVLPWLSIILLTLFGTSMSASSQFCWERNSYSLELYLMPYYLTKPASTLEITTTCITKKTPFIENFEVDSETLACWTIVDQNADVAPSASMGSNIWKTVNTVKYEGTQSFFFKGAQSDVNKRPHNDWLISPNIKLESGNKYKLTYYYRTPSVPFLYDCEFEVLLSESGSSDLSKFTTILVPKKKYSGSSSIWGKEEVIIDGSDSDINIAWHITSSSQYTELYIDKVTLIEEDKCPGPIGFGVKSLETNKATIFWTDDFGATAWEYYVQKMDSGVPTVSGLATSTKEVNISSETSGVNLNENTKYEFYVRTTCIIGGFSGWKGPFIFNTLCNSIPLPFSESFDANSTTKGCWLIEDSNKDAISPTDSNVWKKSTSNYSGTHSMSYYGNQPDASKMPHNDWLISPPVKLDTNKIYRLSYNYKTSSTLTSDFQVVISNSGILPSEFKTVLLDKENSKVSSWEKEILFIQNFGGQVNIAWNITSDEATTEFYIDNIKIEEIVCPEPIDIKITNIKSNQASVSWKDDFSSEWEYILQEPGEPFPTGSGTSTTNKDIVVAKDKNGMNINETTEYEFYVRSKCLNGKFSDWIGPLDFTTICKTITVLPFTESFEKMSETKDCWKIINVNSDRFVNIYKEVENEWSLYNSQAYSGGSCMNFYGASGKSHDDWLISPTVSMDPAEIYQLTYYYKNNTYLDSEFEVLLSTSGTEVEDFTTTLVAKNKYIGNVYKKNSVYITGVSGEANIAWRVTSSNAAAYLYLDMISIEKLDCMVPLNIEVKDIKKDEVTFEWEDNLNSEWEYLIQETGTSLPVGSGNITKSKKVTAKKTFGTSGSNLLPNTQYQIYIRSTCKDAKYSTWIGPIYFTTACDEYTIPFWEGFNTDSKSLSCWTIIDNNNDVSGSYNRWRTEKNYPSEGNQAMHLFGNTATTNLPFDDWLVSPKLKLNPLKLYKLSYYFKTSTNTGNDFRVLLSNTGTDPLEFKKLILDKTNYNDKNWDKEVLYFSGIGGNVHIAWQVSSVISPTYLQIDDMLVEEVECVQPVNLGSKNVTESSADIYWDDDYGFGTEWEYVVQKAKSSTPNSGILIKNKTATITQDKGGKPLEHNTEYEFYVRTKCDNGKFGNWSGPFVFKTNCGVFKTPFFEEFNPKFSETYNCWSFVNDNGDSNAWSTSTTKYEGTHSAYFSGTLANAPHNDWMITPTIEFVAGKTYRLKYFYRTGVSSTDDYEFEVSLSKSGVDISKFTTEIVSKAKYTANIKWVEEYVFIKGVSGNVNIGWHITSNTAIDFYIDSVSIEEVSGCAEPILSEMGVKDLESDQVTIFWAGDSLSKKWEYFVQEAEGGFPKSNGKTTTAIETVVTHENNGKILKHNTEYEFYVRTDCGNGEFSMWQGPFKFTTSCGVFTIPFWEGFNAIDKSFKCWTILDANGDATSPTGNNIWKKLSSVLEVYEGDGSMGFNGTSISHDDWLISPSLKMEPGNYILKYHYKTTSVDSLNTSFEVLMSTSGIDKSKFTTTVIPTKVYKEGGFVEEVKFFNGISGIINLAWHINSKENSYVHLDNISLKKIDSCPEPYDVKLVNQTSNSIDVEWKQVVGVNEWEVNVMTYGGKETDIPIVSKIVKMTPKATMAGLVAGQAYTVYVRAKCVEGEQNSEWSTPIGGATLVGVNDNCSGAINIPVNSGKECDKKVSASFIGASSEVSFEEPTCDTLVKKDIWFEFTATNEIHQLAINDWIDLAKSSLSPIYGALYDKPCSSIDKDAALECFNFNVSTRTKVFRNLIPGQVYYIRLGVDAENSDVKQIFSLCITSLFFHISVSSSGEEYTTEELVKDVFVNSDCDLVSNVRYQNGDGSAKAMAYNTIGYFNKNNTDFPFKEGIVLSTNEVQYVPGPAKGSVASRGDNNERWIGDKDINDAIDDAGGFDGGDKKRVTQLEFDFVSLKETVKFEYMFASVSYHNMCVVRCRTGALFAAWLVDTVTGEGQNLAKVKETNVPIAINTVVDSKKASLACESLHPELYWKHYVDGVDNPAEAYVDFVGLTHAMESKTVKVIPGRKYHIKLAVIDFCENVQHSSAVFFNSGTFDLGSLDLGDDLLIETNNAICDEESKIISASGVATIENAATIIEWYKDEKLLVGENKSELEVKESGIYKIVVKYPDLDCENSGSIVVEIYPKISDIVKKPNPFEVCKYSLEARVLDLNTITNEMFTDVKNKEDFIATYYLEEVEAINGSDKILDTNYLIEGLENRVVYIRVYHTRTGCKEVFQLPIRILKGEEPDIRESVSICGEYIFPELESNQYYYTKAGAGGHEYKAGDVLNIPGEHIIYVLQLNGDEWCYEETSYQVSITQVVKAAIFDDKVLDCEVYVLSDLPANNAYFDEAGGQGNELLPGFPIRTDQTIYVYASSNDGLCEDESSFTISYEDCPIQKGISPNGDGLNDYFDLSNHGVSSLKIYNRYGSEVYSFEGQYTNEWVGQGKGNKILPDGTYYYVVISHFKTRSGWVQINR